MITSAFKNRLGEWQRREDGVAAIEFAMVGSLFLAFLVGIYVAGMYFFTWNRLQYGTEIAARYAAVHDDADEGDLEEIILDNMQILSLNAENLTVVISDDSASGIDFRQVDASYQYTWDMPFIPESLNDTTLSVSSRMAIR